LTVPKKTDDVLKNIESVYRETKNAWADSSARSKECYRFVLNEQWTPEEITAFLKQKAPPIQYNLILPRLNNLSGTEQMNRRSIQIRPFYAEHKETATILTGVLNNIWETERGEDELSKTFTDGCIITKPGCFKISIETNHLGFRDYRFRCIDPFSVFFDPDHRDYFLRDCQYVLQESWLRLDQIIETYGDQAGLKLEGYSKKWWEKLSEDISRAATEALGVSDPENWHDKNANTYKVIEMQARIDAPRYLYIDTQTNEQILLPQPMDEKDLSSGRYYHLGKTSIKKIHITTICPYFKVVLFDQPSWLDTDMYDIIPYYSMDFNNIKSQNSSLVYALLDPQKNLNKREIQKTNYIDRSMISPILFAYEDRDAKEEYDENEGDPHLTLLIRNLKFPPHYLASQQMNSDIWMDINDVKDKMNDISGINDVARGQSEFANESAKLYQMKVQRVGATVNPYLKNLGKTRLMIGQYFLQTCAQVFPELNRLVATRNDRGETETAVLNETSGTSIRNDVSRFLGKVILDEGERSATKLQENIQLKLAVAQIMPPELVNWAWILKDSELPDVDEQIAYIEQVLGIRSQNDALQQQMQMEQFATQQIAAQQQAATPPTTNKPQGAKK